MTLVDNQMMTSVTCAAIRVLLMCLSNAASFSISAVTYMELIQGMRNKHEVQVLRTALAQWRCAILPIDGVISNQAMFYVEQYFHKASLRLADVLIGATAIVHGIPLLTGDAKHYKVLPGLTVRRFRP